MSVSKELFLAILAMNSYNQGDGAVLKHGKTKIGTAELLNNPSGLDTSSWEESGFYAVSYDWDGEKVIAYRGTDNGPDYLRGWSIATGLVTDWTQTDETLEFYTAVTGKQYWEGPAENTILTGHSLGGGLAGLVSALTGTTGSDPRTGSATLAGHSLGGGN